MTNTSSKNRGIFLTILLLYSSLQAVLVFYSGFIYPITTFGLGSTVGRLTLLVSVFEFIPLVAAIYGIWMWKKWGVYSLIAYILISIIATFIFDIVLKLFSGYAQYVISFDIIVAALWFWALRRKWVHFN